MYSNSRSKVPSQVCSLTRLCPRFVCKTELDLRSTCWEPERHKKELAQLAVFKDAIKFTDESIIALRSVEHLFREALKLVRKHSPSFDKKQADDYDRGEHNSSGLPRGRMGQKRSSSSEVGHCVQCVDVGLRYACFHICHLCRLLYTILSMPCMPQLT